MKFKENLIAARSHIVMILGLSVAFGLAIKIEQWNPRQDKQNELQIEKTMNLTLPEQSELTPEENQWAQIAWKYFENNLVSETGLVNSVDKYPSSTLWDTGSYLQALISAYRLKVITPAKFDNLMNAALTALRDLPLFENQLPNKAYHTESLAMVDYNNKPTESGIGWSAIDIGRLLVPFNWIVWNCPRHTNTVRDILAHWNIENMIVEGTLYGAAIDNFGKTIYLQEGRIGYEEYSARSFTLIGYDVSEALKYNDYIELIDINGIAIPTDKRSPQKYGAHNYVVSESYILDGLEFGWGIAAKEFAFRVYSAQKERYNQTGILTAVSEDHIDRPPYFVYNTVFSDGKEWNCITDLGEDASAFRTISTKAAFGWHMLYRTPYTEKLIDEVKELYDPERGWYSGLYEKTKKPNKAITCNTNGIILETLCYKAFGKQISMVN